MLKVDALGVGLRPSFATALCEQTVRVDFVEILVENYLGRSSIGRQYLKRIAAHTPIVGHGVALNLLGSGPLDWDYLRQVKALIDEFQLPYMSDHLCWTAHRGVTHHDLLPAPYARDLVNYAAERAQQVQEFLGVPFGIENLSSYVRFARDELQEWEFLRRVVDQAGCWYMLDVNNAYVSSRNHGFQTQTYLESVNWKRVLQVHVAGHTVRADGLHHDTHDREVSDAVWQCYAEAWRLGGPFPTLLEWDAAIPPLERVLAELDVARTMREPSLVPHPGATR